ncbi:hypothetical protein LTS17_006990 [Exophiala oligosperma]
MASLTHKFLPFRNPRPVKRKGWSTSVNHGHRAVVGICTCGKHHPRQMSLCLVLPRHRFGSSRFNTIVLLFLRLFYHAGSFEMAPAAATTFEVPKLSSTSSVMEVSDTTESEKTPIVHRGGVPELLNSYRKLSTQEWLRRLSNLPENLADWKVCSITWIKALASPFSHEFLQFVVQDVRSGRRTRLAAGREEDGDWVLVGWDWASGETPSDHYKLPLPLLSLEFDDRRTRPSMFELAGVLAATTRRRPHYRFRREMCWWYAETVLDEMSAKHGGSVTEWRWSRYRYSFVVKTTLIRRSTLTRHAEAFKARLAAEMSY